MSMSGTQLSWGKSKISINGDENIPVADSLGLSLKVKSEKEGFHGDGEVRRSYTATFNPSCISGKIFCYRIVAEQMVRDAIELFRADLRNRRFYGLRIPRKMKKRAKRFEAEYIAKLWGLPVYDILAMMRKR